MRRIISTAMLLAACAVSAQPTGQIVWREVAMARSNAPGLSPTVQSVASASASAAATEVKVDRVVVAPAVIKAVIGKAICISQLDIAAYTDSGERAEAVPLTVDMQQDHLRKLTFSPKASDLCFRPQQAGEYAIRFSSKVPAADGTLRGAQVFVRAS